MRFAVTSSDPRFAELVRRLDREGTPAAETWRAVGRAADELDLTRPSYQVVRRLVAAERRRRRIVAERNELLLEAAARIAAGGVPNVLRTLDRLDDLRRAEGEVVEQEHKPL